MIWYLNYTDWDGMPEHRLAEYCGSDASKWAEAFCHHAKKLGHDIDEGWMIGWFANAIMVNRDELQREIEELERSGNDEALLSNGQQPDTKIIAQKPEDAA